MRHLTLGVVVYLLVGLSATATAQPTDPQIMAPVNTFIEAFNKGDMAAAAATHAKDIVIVDEVPPFMWRGVQAFQAWGAALDADAKKRGMTEPKVTIKAPTRSESDGSTAYVIVPATFSFVEKGTSMSASSQLTFILKKEGSAWLIHSWTWTGPRARPSAPAVKK